MTGYKTDYQQKRVYAWEREAIAPHDKGNIPFDQVQSIIDYIWTNEGWKYPPKVKLLSGHEKRGAWARGNRHGIWIRPTGLPTWVLLHELSHALTSSEVEGFCGRHGKTFVGVYLRLVSKYLNLSLPLLMAQAKLYNVRFDITAQPIFLD